MSGFMNVSVADAHVQRLDLVVKIITVLGVYYRRSVFSFSLFLWAEELNAEDINKENFLLTVGSVCCVKWFITGSRNVANVSLMTKSLERRCGSG
jgi:hypothetical protein